MAVAEVESAVAGIYRPWREFIVCVVQVALRLVTVYFVVVACCASVRAGDLPIKAQAPAIPTLSWTGFYFGEHIGAAASYGAWNSATGILSRAAFTPFQGSGVNGGAISGIQLGYNRQFGAFVIGAEADASFGVIAGVAGCARATFNCLTTINQLSTVAARFGYAADNFLFYGKAGGAWAQVDRQMTTIITPANDVFSGSENLRGWTIGAGAEYAFNPGLSAKIEYDYVDFGSKSLSMTDLAANISNITIAQNAHLVKLGLNHRLDALPLFSNGAAVAVVSLPQWSWTGFYVGAHAGGAFGFNQWATSATTALQAISTNGAFVGLGATEGLLGGGQIGVNYQFGTWVAGLEIAASAADIDGYAKCLTNIAKAVSFSCHSNVSSIGTMAGRLGETWGNLMTYNKVGVAWATDHGDAQSSFFTNSFNESSTRWGWLIGSGLEYAFSPNLSGFVEYNHLEFGSRNITYVDQFGLAPVVAFQQKLNLVKLGVNYRLGSGAPILNANAAMPLFVKAPQLPSGWSIEAGARYFASSGRMQNDLYSSATPWILGARSIYADQTAHTAETFYRFDHHDGLFVKGNFGLGYLVDGQLNNEGFPPGLVPAGTPRYSNTISQMGHGQLLYGSADIGYDFINEGGRKLGAYVGYRSFSEQANGFGCRQLATGTTCNPSTLSTAYLNLSDAETWRAVAVGGNMQVPLSEKLRLEVDGAYLPYASHAGFDNQWLHSIINPTPETGHGWGSQFEAVLSYALSDRLRIGAGGRYWFFATDTAQQQFPGSGAISPMKFYSERYGGFLQASYTFGDLDPAEVRAKGITKAPAGPATDWTGLYVGGSIGSGLGRSRYADPFPRPASGDDADLGGALLGGKVGYNHQIGAWVGGLEASANWANIQGTNTCFGAFPTAAVAGFNCGSQIGAIGALTARAGYAIDRSLLYLRGGAAWDRQGNQFNTSGVAGGATLSNASTNRGWTIGGGLEYALRSNWSAALEYNWYDFGASDVFTTTVPAALRGVPLSPYSTRAQTVSLSVNYKITPSALTAK
jgi:opacity protein-like surface antigen